MDHRPDASCNRRADIDEEITVIKRTLLALIFAIGVTPAMAQPYPNKQITLVVNSAAGGPVDGAARAIKDEMQATLGQPLVVDHRLAAGGTTGASQVAKAEPNGYTLLVSGTGPIAISPLLSKDLGYDPYKELMPLALIVSVPTLMITPLATPAQNLQEFLALVKRQPGQLNYASVGNGTPSHLATEMFKHATGLSLVHVPYKGSPQAQTAVLSNEVALYFAPLSAIQYVRSGRVRALAVTSATRAKTAPDVPTTREQGVDFEFVAWFGLFAPAGTSADIADRVTAAALKALNTPQAQQQITNFFGVDPSPLGQADFARFLQDDRARWVRAVKEAGVKAD
jgi:tripartite-type tricarboxylate transporter receptor subunit TctC